MGGLTAEQVLSGTQVASSGSTGGGGTLGYDDIKALAVHAGADPSWAGIMARMALAESGGNPKSNASHKTSYVEKGKTYYPEGLWQISTVHGTGGGSMFSALANARQAVQLFKAQGFGPWEASRFGGAGGGWGQYLHQELGLPAGAQMSGPRVCRRHDAAAEPAADGRSEVSVGSNASRRAAGDSPRIKSWPERPINAWRRRSDRRASHEPEGRNRIPPELRASAGGVIVKDVKRAGDQPSARAALAAGALRRRMFRTKWDYAIRHPMGALFNVLGASSRMGMAAVSDLGAGKPGDIVKDVWHSIWAADDHEMTKLTAGTQSAMHLPTHQAIDAWVKQNVPKWGQGVARTIIGGADDFAPQMLADPLTYTGLGEVVKGAEALKYIHPLFAGGRVALQAWKAADKMGAGKFFTHLRTLSKTYDTVAASIGKTKDYFTVRPDLKDLSPEAKQARMQIEGRVNNQFDSSVGDTDKALTSGDPKQAEQVFLRTFLAHGSKKNATMAGKMLGYKGDELKTLVGKTTNTVKEANLKDALTQFVEKTAPDETPADMLARRVKALKKIRIEATDSAMRQQTEDYITRFGTTDDKKLDVAKISTGDREAGRGSPKGSENFPLLKMLRNWERNAIKLNPLPHSVKNVGELAYLAGGPRTVVEGLVHAATGVDGKIYAADAKVGHYAGESMMKRLQTIGGAAPEAAYDYEGITGPLKGTMSKAMVRIENGWRQAVLGDKMLKDRQRPTRWGTEWEDKDEILKGAIVNDRLGDYRNSSPPSSACSSRSVDAVCRFSYGHRSPQHHARTGQRFPRGSSTLRARSTTSTRIDKAIAPTSSCFTIRPPTSFAKLVTNPGATRCRPSGFPMPSRSNRASATHGRNRRRDAHRWPIHPGGVSLGEDAVRVGLGVSMPGPGKGHQPMTLVDQIAVSVLLSLGMYFHQLPSAKTEKARKRDIDKGGF